MDNILIQKRFRNAVKTSKSLPGADCDSNDIPLMCKLRMAKANLKFQTDLLKSDEKLRDKIAIAVHNRNETLNNISEVEELRLSMFKRDSGDSTVLCPFDNTHVILAKSFNSHLVKCRKNYQHLKKVPCKFDRTHMILKPELHHHHSVCPSRHLLDRELQVRAGTSHILKGNVSGPEIQSAYVESTEEDWDAGPRYTATNALFSSKKSYIEHDEEEDNTYHGVGTHDPSAAASSSSISSEENFRRVPLAPSKAAQLSGPLAAKPQGSSSLVYEYSVQQVVQGRGRGRGVPSQSGPDISSARPLGSNERKGLIAQAPISIPHLGRGIMRYATQEKKAAGAPVARGRGNVESFLTAPACQGIQAISQHQPTLPGGVPVRSQFEDPEDTQAQRGGTSSTVEEPAAPATGLTPKLGEGAALLSVEEMKALLLDEEKKNEQEREELKLQQELRHQQLLERLWQSQIQQQQRQQTSTYNPVAAASQAQVQQGKGTMAHPPGFGPRQLNHTALPTRGRGRGLEPSFLRTPNSQSVAQGLQAHYKTVQVDEDQVSEISESDSQFSMEETQERNADGKRTVKEDFSKMGQEELRKSKRKMVKKMKQIALLEKKASEGFQLSPEEEAKLRKKESIVKSLERVNDLL
ncbi:gametocyte-specific factor 1 [Plakobranchus ocellatus]|uniref:Gametocyte-specific factor 1 n=1 Tax=Plakobranchus ocellatus TaxID=259542 RepID=A0AAV3ZRR4_9GAST|nr:gametocyte-specific factor 1 [Plakobranchus ocellatus]